MNVTPKVHHSTPFSVGQGLLAAVGTVAALVATYWDDAWHTDIGRDDAFVPPHLLLYGGVAVAALAVLAWGLRAWGAAGWGGAGLRRVLADPALCLASIGGAVTLASAPVDVAWHAAYGRDAVLWSPPHLTAVVGTLALSLGVLAGLRTATGRGAGTARLAAAAGVIGALQVPVLEYDSDVAQFAVVWFLPVAALGLCLAAALLEDLLPGRWAPVGAAALYTALRAGTVGLLAALGFSLTAVPPVLPLLAMSALLAARALALRLVLLGALAPLAWWPALQAQAAVTTVVPAGDLPLAVVLGAAAGLLVAMAHGDLPVPRRAALVPGAAVLLAVGLLLGPGARPASAHDPGQGEPVRQGALTVDRPADQARLTLLLPGRCGDLTPARSVARRAGTVLTGPLEIAEQDGDCRLTGVVDGLTGGRWFVYAEARDGSGRTLEAWLPAASDSTLGEVRPLYAPPSTSSTATRELAGGALLVVVAALLLGCLRLARRVRGAAA